MWNNQLTTDTSIQFAGRILSSGFTFIATLFLARKLGAENFGEYTKILAFLALFQVAVDFGLNQVYLKQYSKSYKEHLPLFLFARCVFALGLSLIAILIITGLPYFNFGLPPVIVKGVLFGTLIIIGYGLNLTFTSVFQMQHRFLKIIAGQILGAFVMMVMAYYFSLQHEVTLNPLYAVGAVTAGLWVNAFVLFPGIKIKITWYGRGDLYLFVVRLFKESWPLGVTLILNALLFRMDTFFLAIFRTSFEVGAYGFAYKFFEVALVIPTFIMTSLYPQLVGEKNLPKVRYDLQQLFVGMFLLSIIVVILVWLVAPVMPFIKKDYTDSVLYLRLLILSLPLFFLTSPLMWFYILAGKLKYLLVIYAGGMIVNIFTNWWLVPFYGAVAAAVTTGITEASVLVIGFIFLVQFSRNKIWTT